MGRIYNARAIAATLAKEGYLDPNSGKPPTLYGVRSYVQENFPSDQARTYRNVLRWLISEWFIPSVSRMRSEALACYEGQHGHVSEDVAESSEASWMG